MKNITNILRAATFVMISGVIITISACGNSDSASDKSSVGKEETQSSQPAVGEAKDPVSESADGEKRTVKGELLKIEGDSYVMKDGNGTVQTFQATPNTLVDEGMEPGHRIIVNIGEDGSMIAVRKDR